MSVLLSVFEDNPDVQRLEALMRAHDVDHSGTISYDEFLNLLLSDGQLALSLADMKRLKKTLVHYSTGSRCPRSAWGRGTAI